MTIPILDSRSGSEENQQLILALDIKIVTDGDRFKATYGPAMAVGDTREEAVQQLGNCLGELLNKAIRMAATPSVEETN